MPQIEIALTESTASGARMLSFEAAMSEPERRVPTRTANVSAPSPRVEEEPVVEPEEESLSADAPVENFTEHDNALVTNAEAEDFWESVDAREEKESWEAPLTKSSRFLRPQPGFPQRRWLVREGGQDEDALACKWAWPETSREGPLYFESLFQEREEEEEWSETDEEEPALCFPWPPIAMICWLFLFFAVLQNPTPFG
jgi:hypothetical protein